MKLGRRWDLARANVAYARSWEPGGPNWNTVRSVGQDPTRDLSWAWCHAAISVLEALRGPVCGAECALVIGCSRDGGHYGACTCACSCGSAR